jgi:predicted NUDIX family NTP pyrophosphohydrolase
MKKSAGIILFRNRDSQLQVFLVHPGGPFWKNKDAGAWTIPKGEFTDEEDALEAAKREFKEEVGISIKGNFIPLQPVKQKSGKWVYAWALEKDLDSIKIKSNFFEIEWPPKSGQLKQFPEIDKGEWFTVEEAKLKIIPAQISFVEELNNNVV